MEHEQEPLSSVNDLQTENRALREKVQEYKKLEEDLMAQRVYEKALRWDRIEKRPKSSILNKCDNCVCK
jgi:cell shape-determining protein MreC